MKKNGLLNIGLIFAILMVRVVFRAVDEQFSSIGTTVFVWAIALVLFIIAKMREKYNGNNKEKNELAYTSLRIFVAMMLSVNILQIVEIYKPEFWEANESNMELVPLIILVAGFIFLMRSSSKAKRNGDGKGLL